MTKGSPSAKQVSAFATETKVQLLLHNGTRLETTLYFYDPAGDCVVFYATKTGDLITELRIIRRLAIKELNTQGENVNSAKADTATGPGKSTPKKSGSATPVNVNTKQNTSPPTTTELSDHGRLLLEGLSKHLAVSNSGASIIVTLTSGAARIDPPYTKVEGTGDELDKVRRIFESERGILPKKAKRKDVNLPIKGG